MTSLKNAAHDLLVAQRISENEADLIARRKAAIAAQKSGTKAADEGLDLTDLDGVKVGTVVRRENVGTTPKLTRAALKSNAKLERKSAGASASGLSSRKQDSTTAKASAKAEPSTSPKEGKTMATKTKKTKTAKAPAKRDLNPCLCGCKQGVVGMFKQGHDARLKGMLLRGEVKNPSAEQKAFAKKHGVKIGANKK